VGGEGGGVSTTTNHDEDLLTMSPQYSRRYRAIGEGGGGGYAEHSPPAAS